MLRSEALEAMYPDLASCAVVTIMGATASELYALGHRPNFFYLEHAMGLASSMGLGIALNRPEETVVVLDGDGSILMNLGSLTTMARYRPSNLIHVVFDNEVLLSVGKSFTTATATGSSIAALAEAAGVPRSATVDTVEGCRQAFQEALAARELTTLVVKVAPQGPSNYHMDVHMLENRFEFQRYLTRERQGAG